MKQRYEGLLNRENVHHGGGNQNMERGDAAVARGRRSKVLVLLLGLALGALTIYSSSANLMWRLVNPTTLDWSRKSAKVAVAVNDMERKAEDREYGTRRDGGGGDGGGNRSDNGHGDFGEGVATGGSDAVVPAAKDTNAPAMGHVVKGSSVATSSPAKEASNGAVVNFPSFSVDVVYTWVKGDTHNEDNICYSGAETSTKDVGQRFRNLHTLRFSLRSLRLYMP